VAEACGVAINEAPTKRNSATNTLEPRVSAARVCERRSTVMPVLGFI
jgi:hypothetical protein